MRHRRTLRGVIALAIFPVLAAGQVSEIPLDPRDLGLSRPVSDELERAIAAGDWRAAELLLFESSVADPGHAGLLRGLGVAHHQAGRHYLAATALKRADAIEPLRREHRYLLASAFLSLGRRHWARAELERLVSQFPGIRRYRYALARIFYDQQRFSEAAEAVRAILGDDPKYAGGHDLLGQCLEALGSVAAAERAYREAISLNGHGGVSSPWPHYHLGSLLHDSGDLEGAEASLRSATAADPGHVPAFRELGVVLRKSHRAGEAAEALETASRLAPEDAAIQYALGGAYRALGKTDLAAAAFQRFRELSGGSGR